MATTKAPAGEAEETKASTVPAARRVSRAVIWLGLAAGTALTVLAVMHGVRVPGLEVVLSVLATWALLMVLAVTAAELTRRYHRPAAAHAWRHSKRAALFTGRHGWRGGGWLARQSKRGGIWLVHKSAERWQARKTASTPGRTATGGPGGAPGGTPAGTLAGSPPTDPPGTATGAGTPPPEGTTTMPDTVVTDDSTTGPKTTRLRSGGGPVSIAWKQVIADTSDFEPEDDAHLLAWMASEVTGMANYAEAMAEVYETCVNTVGLDPVAMQATHDVADAAADAANAMSAARAKFAGHYSEVREFAARGGLLPFDGRWVTGDGD
jgi:hypothetical protein